MVESTGLENRHTLIAYLGFKSLSLRHIRRARRNASPFRVLAFGKRLGLGKAGPRNLYGLPWEINKETKLKQGIDAHLYTGFFGELPRPKM